jgi:resuscitation-promoting factor RpfB
MWTINSLTGVCMVPRRSLSSVAPGRVLGRRQGRGAAGGRASLALCCILLSLAVLSLSLAGCGQPQPIQARVVVDGQRHLLEVTAASAITVGELLDAAGVSLGELDRVDPDLYNQVSDGMTVAVTRVEESFVTETEPLPFTHKTVRSEAVPEGRQRLLQAGQNGEVEIVYRIVLEDGTEVSRAEVRRDVVVEPVDETVLVGVQGQVASVPISGTIVYLSGGNAWIMRESTDLRRNITGSGDLDGRVFALSPDGRYLLFTRALGGEAGDPLNSLWLARTSLIGEEPQSLGVGGVVWAEWAPQGRQVALSTAERVAGLPGWKAKNDLWLVTLAEEGSGSDLETELILPPTAEIPYAWWGRSYAWSPDGSYLAYAQADEVGVLSLADGLPWSLVQFPSYRTQSSWAWVPGMSWSPDSRLLAFVRHEGDVEGLDAEDSPVFGLWVASLDGTLDLQMAEEVGMWSAPRWAPGSDGRLIYGQAQSPRNSQDSRYELLVMDRDGSNKRLLFPPEGFMGLVAPDVVWSPWGNAILFSYEGDIYRQDVDGGTLERLTSDSQSSQPRWAW